MATVMETAMQMTTMKKPMINRNTVERKFKVCPCDKSLKYISRHLPKVPKLVDKKESHAISLSAPKCKMTKRQLLLLVAGLPFTRAELDAIWKKKDDIKQYLDTGVLSNELDSIITKIINKYVRVSECVCN